MLEVRVKQLQNQACRDFMYNKSLNARLVTFLWNEAVEKEAAEKEASVKEAVEKEATKEDEDDEEEQEALPLGSSDNDNPVNPIRFPRVMCWLKCPICLNYLYKHKNGLLFHIESFIKQCHCPMWSNNISIFLGCSICNHE
jgi:hypothetical protein